MKLGAIQISFKSASDIVAQTRKVSSREGLNNVENSASEFIDTHIKELHRLSEQNGYAVWDLYTLGGEEVSKRENGEDDKTFNERLQRLQKEYGDGANRTEKAVLDFKHNPNTARALIPIHVERDKISNTFLRRQVELAHTAFSEYDVDPLLKEEISKREIGVSLMYGDFTPEYKGKKLTDTELEQMIKETKGTDGAKEATELVKIKLNIGNHRVDDKGPTIAEAILELIKLRNLYARKARSPNYYSYSLKRQEINEGELVKLMTQVKEAIKPTYDNLRKKMDIAVMKRYGVTEAEARLPWFQGGVYFPAILDDVMNFSPNECFTGRDPRPILKETARLIGTNADSIVDKSDLFPRPGKNPHWYLFDLRIPDDIRSIGNMDPHFQINMGEVFSTELHEVMGHGIGYSLVDPSLPHLFRALHTIITESDAMMMEDLMYNEHWLREVIKADEETIQAFITQGKQYRLAQNLIKFFHNYILIPDFERDVYRLRDEEITLDNVNKLWAQKVGEYLGIMLPGDRNEPDWAYKIHFATAPAYYQCYFLGQLVRAQVNAKINELSKRGLLSTECGDFLKQYRAVGESYPWFELVKHMTGNNLGADALKAEFDQLNV